MADHRIVEETELLSRDRGRRVAEAWAKSPGVLEIPDTLLNSEDIITVVRETGLVSPFYVGTGRKSRLKKAAYEGRVGSKAYIYKDRNAPERIFDAATDDYLLVPKNSIVFVESDLDFRLPDFIALRFNLQIQHVHRGLLLGTGPLVDPGFWGKLCIPLHNLTDEDYEIPKNEGLIWIEFTKTTLSSNKADEARVPLEAVSRDLKGHWEIEKFLDKAASQYRGHKVPIRSSLPTMFGEATAAATKSAEDAQAAKEDAKAALDVADKFRFYNFLSMVAAAVGFVAVCIAVTSFLFNLSSRNEDIAEKIKTQADTAQKSIDDHITDVDRYALQPAEVRASVPGLQRRVNEQRAQIADLTKRLNQVDAHLKQVEQKLSPPSFR